MILPRMPSVPRYDIETRLLSAYHEQCSLGLDESASIRTAAVAVARATGRHHAQCASLLTSAIKRAAESPLLKGIL
jgi:hypothetical protein